MDRQLMKSKRDLKFNEARDRTTYKSHLYMTGLYEHKYTLRDSRSLVRSGLLSESILSGFGH